VKGQQLRVNARRFNIVAAFAVLMVGAAPLAHAEVCDGAAIACTIGDTGPGGGVVFYDAGSRQAWGRYLEAAPAGWVSNPVTPPPIIDSPAPSPTPNPSTSASSGTPSTSAVPGPPRSVAAVGIKGGLRVTWRPVAGSGVRYLVSTSPSSAGCRTARASCTVTGLKAGRSYTVQVAAVNSQGEGTPSKPVQGRVPIASAPQPAAPAPKPEPEYRSYHGSIELLHKRSPAADPLPAEDPSVLWCPWGTPGAGAVLFTGTPIGTGRSNTQIIINACGESTAAGVAARYRGGGRQDWFLPSRDELNALFLQRSVVGGFDGNAILWSSSQPSMDLYSTYKAWNQSFSFGNQAVEYVGEANRVRPIRAF